MHGPCVDPSSELLLLDQEHTRRWSRSMPRGGFLDEHHLAFNPQIGDDAAATTSHKRPKFPPVEGTCGPTAFAAIALALRFRASAVSCGVQVNSGSFGRTSRKSTKPVQPCRPHRFVHATSASLTMHLASLQLRPCLSTLSFSGCRIHEVSLRSEDCIRRTSSPSRSQGVPGARAWRQSSHRQSWPPCCEVAGKRNHGEAGKGVAIADEVVQPTAIPAASQACSARACKAVAAMPPKRRSSAVSGSGV